MSAPKRRRLSLPRSLRGRLLLALLVLAAVVLLALDAVIYTALRGYLMDRTDTTLRAVQNRVVKQVRNAEPPAEGLAAGARMLGTSEYFLEIHRPDGSTRTLVPGLRDPHDPPPRLPEPLRSAAGTPVTVPAATGGGPDYRLLIRALPDRRGTLVVAVPLKTLDGTMRRLLLIEAVATVGGLGLLAGVGLLIVRRGLMPLESMARDADAIAAGRTGHRVRPAEPDTEVGRLGLALNTMLEGQAAVQARLRQFVADASHELRTPVTAVLGYADLHHQGALVEPAQRDRTMGRITDEALRMRCLVDDLLLLARLDVVRPAVPAAVDLGAVVDAALGAARVVAPDRPLVVDAAHGAVVEGDGEQLRRLVDNLLANVRAHTPAGTAAQVRVQLRENTAVLEVHDDGPGIAADALPYVCERFYRADAARGGDGSGLGLAIVAAVAAAHGGRVEVHSPPGEGALVRVLLPLAATRSSGV